MAMTHYKSQISVRGLLLVAVSIAGLFTAVLTSVDHAEAQEILAPTNVPEAITSPVSPGDTHATIPFSLANSGAIRLQALVPIDGAALIVSDASDAPVGEGAVVFTASNDLGVVGVPGGEFILEGVVLPVGDYTANFSFPSATERTAIMVTIGTAADAGGPAYEIALVVPEPRVVVGDAATFGVLLLKNGEPLTGLSPDLEMIDEGGALTPILLADDGQDADGVADDGLYSSEVELGSAGHFDLKARVSFVGTGGDVELSARGSVEVLSQSGEIVGVESQFVYAPEGCIGALTQTMSLDIIDPGTFILAGGIVSGEGIIEKRVNNAFAIGAAQEVLTFDASELRRAIGEGTVIEAVEPQLFSLGQEIDLQDVATAPLDLKLSAELCREEPIIFGNVSAEPIILGGFISALEFTVPVDVADGGNYQFSFTVSAGGGEEVAIVTFNSVLASGLNEVTFQVHATEMQQVDGPYQVVSGLAIGPSGSLLRTGLGESDFFSRWQFAPDRAGDLDADGDVDSDDRSLLASFRNVAVLVPGDRRDLNRDGVIDVRDLREILRLR